MGLFFHKKKETTQDSVEVNTNTNVSHLTMDEIKAFKESSQTKSEIPKVVDQFFDGKNELGGITQEQVKQSMLQNVENNVSTTKNKEILTILIPEDSEDDDENEESDDFELSPEECVIENMLDASDRVKRIIEESYDDFVDGVNEKSDNNVDDGEEKYSEEYYGQLSEKLDRVEAVLDSLPMADKEFLETRMKERNWPLDWVIQDYLNGLSNSDPLIKEVIDKKRDEFVQFLTNLVNE